ncbi:MarR family transcriptional regulator [Oxalobacteraceae bacterium OM1]|nr:MarR family transcriptional regulator [Oxalobacteraceae bacterium OM1]
MLTALDDELVPLGVTAAQFIIVLGVSHHEAHTPSELCRLLACDSGAMTRLLDRIEAKGIVRRVRNLEDRRTIRIELTDKGRALHPHIMHAVTRVHERLVQDFTDTDLEQLHDGLRRLAANAAGRQNLARIPD